MKSERILLLEKYLEEDPANAFNYYALALEFITADPARAQQLFQVLMAKFPDYLPTYYQAALVYLEAGDTEKGIRVATLGVEKATEQRNLKTRSELQNLINSQEDY